MSDNNSLDSSHEAPELSLGQQLSAARARAGLSRSDIIATLHVSEAMLESIEQDTIDPALNPLFTKGYIKSYASLVHLDKSKMLALYAAQYGGEVATKEMQTFSNRTKLNEHNSYLNYFSFLVVVGLLAALVWWWIQKENNSVVIPATIVEQSQQATVTIPDVTTAIAPVTSADNNLPLVPVTTTEPKPVVKEPVKVTIDAIFNFSKDCWIKVTDSSNETLAIGIKKAGHAMTLTGVPPFDVILGAPDAVSITYQDEVLDITKFINGKTARFSVPLDN